MAKLSINQRKMVVEELTANYLDSLANTFPDDQDIEKVLADMEIAKSDEKRINNLELDTLSRLAVASIMGY